MRNSFGNEKWKNIDFLESMAKNEVYQISTYGKVKSFKVDPVNGMVIKLFTVEGYERLPFKQKNGKRNARYIHKLVAEAFMPKSDEAQEYVIHLDYNKTNNNIWNLRWATQEEKDKHLLNNPLHKESGRRVSNSKLTENQVRLIKRRINNPKRKTRLKIIAKEFGISEMQLHRIKTGENWGHITDE